MNVSPLTLRAPEPEDVDFLYSIENEEGGESYSCRIAPVSLESLRTYVLTCDPDPFASGQLRLVISRGSENVGLIDFYDISALHRRAMVGVIIAPQYRGMGLGRRSVSVACSFAAKRLRLTTLGALISIHNNPSVAAFAHAGFETVGRLTRWWNNEEDCLMMQKILSV